VLAIAVLKESWYIQATTSLLCSKKLIRIGIKQVKLELLIYFYIKVFNKVKFSEENGIINLIRMTIDIAAVGK
jgi:hypothetical protein